MTRFWLCATLFNTAALAFGCGSPKHGSECSNANAFEARKLDARATAETEYEPPAIIPCPDLDPPLDGQAASVGLTASEYGALLRGANGNFFDDHTWWLKATPRGESHVVPMQITAERCDPVMFAKFGYEYRFATPPLSAAPECGRYLTGLAVGHQLADSWPQIFGVEGSGLIQLAPLAAGSGFGAWLRVPQAPLSVPGRDSTLDRLDVVRHDGDSLELVVLANGSTLASALRLVLKVGDASRLSVQLELDPRALGKDSPLIAVAALSGWFSNTEGHDFERVRATFVDGSTFETALSDPGIAWGTGEWTKVPIAQSAVMLDSFGFLQNGGPRSNVVLSNLQSSEPIFVDLSVSTSGALGGNVVANLLVDGSAAIAAGTPITVSYLVTAESP
jgi:hypothetical protein